MAATLRELLGDVSPIRVTGAADVVVAGLAHDSRRVRPGDLFFALRGSRTDGNRFVKAAISSGAVAVLSELEPPPPPVALAAAWVQVGDVAQAMGRVADRFFGHPSRALTVIGVTGTNGKTTTTYFLESIIAACVGRPAVIGTVDYRLCGKALSTAPNTTPISVELLRLLARFRDERATHALMEVSSHALALRRVDEIEFDAAVFTNLQQDHLDFHGDVESYVEAKARLFDLLVRPSSSKKRRVAALNADDPRTPLFRRHAVGAEIVSFGFGPEATFRGESVFLDLAGAQFDVTWNRRKLRARVNLVGEHNIRNALGAAAVALGLGLPEDGVIAGLAALSRVPGRLEPVHAGQDFSVLVDYAHTESALDTVLSYLRQLPHERIITVFGCGGDRDRTKRGPMGVVACRGSDEVFVTSDNPRSEDPNAIIADIEEGPRAAGLKNYRILPDRRAAIRAAVARARRGDIVLIAGKGHEDYQFLKTGTIRFDDREEARVALLRRRDGRATT